MLRKVNIQFTCRTVELEVVKNQIEKFRPLFHVTIIPDSNEDNEQCPIKTESTSTVICTSLIEHKDEIKTIRSFLNELGVKVERLQHEKVETLTKHTIYSGLVVAGLVTIVSISHNLNIHFFDDPTENIFIPMLLGALGFGLEILIIHKERNI